MKTPDRAKLASLFAAAFLATGSLFSLPAAYGASPTHAVKVTAIVEHPALDAVRQGTYDVLVAEGYEEGRDFSWEFQSAQGNTAIAGQIAKKFAGDKPDVIVAIGTPSAQAMVSAVRGATPIVFSAVTDPLTARLVKDLDKPGANVTGASDALPLERHLDLIMEMLPQTKKIGVLFNPSEINSVAVVERMRELGAPLGVEIVEGPAPDTNSVQSAARALVGKADVFYIPTDNTVVAAMEGAARISTENGVPLFAADVDLVSRGALAALGLSYYQLGRQTGEKVVRILKGEKPGDIPVSAIENINLVINASVAERIGLTVPESVVQRAEIIGK